MLVFMSFICAVMGIGYSLTAKKIFEKGLCESDSYRMIIEFGKSKKMRRYSTIFFIISTILFVFYLIQFVINYKTK